MQYAIQYSINPVYKMMQYIGQCLPKTSPKTQIRPEKHTGYVLQCPHSDGLLHHCDPLQRAVIPFSAVGGSVAWSQTVTTAQTAQIISLKLGLTICRIICTDTSGQWSSLIFE